MLLGLMDRRLRYHDDVVAQPGPVRMLGMLPYVDESAADEEGSEQLLWGVNHIRTLLQIGIDQDQAKIIAITSALSGTGKTSMTLALGSSFASTRKRVLLIDFDLCGMGLTRRLDAVVQKRLGNLAIEKQLVDEEQLQQALEHAEVEGCLLGDSLVALGFADRSMIDQLVEEQAESRRGLPNVLHGEPLAECTTPTDVPGLSILPVGRLSSQQSGKVGSDAIRQVFAQAREQYDVVVVDTGPVPGTVETSFIASTADRVVMMVARGEQRADYERAVGHLVSLDANLAGVVFNRASPVDVRTSTYSRSAQSKVPA